MIMHHFWAQMAYFFAKIFFQKTININFMCLLAPSIVQNFKKSLDQIDSYDIIFGLKITQLPCLLKIFKKILWADPVIIMYYFLAHNGQFALFIIFGPKTTHLP